MPPRSSRRRGGSQRWLIVPFVLTILVLLVDASMHARSPQPQVTMTSQAWVDRVLPDIGKSSAQGLEIAQISSDKLTATAAVVSKQLSSIASAAASTYRAVRTAAPPGEVAPAAGLLQACLAARRDGSEQMALAVEHLLGGSDEPEAVTQMTTAVSDFEVSDNGVQAVRQGDAEPGGQDASRDGWPGRYLPAASPGRLQAAPPG